MAGTALRSLVVAAVLMTTTSCGFVGDKLAEDERLATDLSTLKQRGGSVLLRDLVPGRWTRVHLFQDPVSRNHVEKKVRAPVKMEDEFFSQGTVLVFMRDSEVERATYVGWKTLPVGVFGANVRLSTPGPPVPITWEE